MDFVILKVNGTDVSSFHYEDAVNAFLSAPEPVVVEVRRRVPDSSSSATSSSCGSRSNISKLVSTAVQTEMSTYSNLEETSFDSLTHDVDFEEVTLKKCSSDEKLGLTVCYSSGSEVDTYTEVFIQDITPQSLADRDGRLRYGDQILQVNGRDVSSKEETENIFAENRIAVTLLVSRCLNQSDEFLAAESPSDLLSSVNHGAAYQNSLIEQLIEQQADYLNSLKTEKPIMPLPSQLNLTNSLTRTRMNMINSEISELEQRMKNIQLVKNDKRRGGMQLPEIPSPPPESDSEHIYETIPESADSEVEPIYSCPYEAKNEKVVDHWAKNQKTARTPSKSIGFQEAKPKEAKKNKNSSGEDHENSSSAYNTGGSSNSNPLTVELGCSDAHQKGTSRSTLVLWPQERAENSKVNKSNYESIRQINAKPKKNKGTLSKMSPCSPSNKVPLLSDTMYTNAANLQQTMLLQQQLFRQARAHTNYDVACKPTTSFTAPSLSQYQFVSSPQVFKSSRETTTTESKMEWKVKRRSDGTRYIARRPVRSRYLKSRAIRISEERAGTTEDDTVSELKVGKYWTRDERKKHLEKSKERKQRQETLLASKHLEENSELYQKSVDKLNQVAAKKISFNLDSSSKKHKSRRGHKDGHRDSSRVQEGLTNGPKVIPNPDDKILGLLSVTTV